MEDAYISEIVFRGTLALAALSVVLGGCGGGSERPAKLSDVVGALQDRGLALDRRQPTPPGVLEVGAAVYGIAGGELEVFEFTSNEQARAAADDVDPGGYSISRNGLAVQVEWIGPPHWHLAGKQIALYLGTSPRVLDALEAVAGPQFAGA